ncbi:hypothetical protein ABZ078_10650 [Streptomyces sp. NPDC006385]|uniref:hypothetical protein n=1 Tax=Streptomyces sp. NPDC006385 TaxID=3156761 RepID=UPI0033B37678
MASRIERQRRDEGSGYGHMQKALVVDNDNPEGAAYRRLLEHCPACQTSQPLRVSERQKTSTENFGRGLRAALSGTPKAPRMPSEVRL